jgi:hypothetical protein
MRDITEHKQEMVEPQGKDLPLGSNLEAMASRSRASANRRTIIVSIVAVVGIVAVAIVALIYWRSGSTGAGRPVPTPRNISAEQPGTATSTEPTITLEPSVAVRAGIKTEPVGEALMAGGAMPGQTTTVWFRLTLIALRQLSRLWAASFVVLMLS